jgi:hypothetical protein
MRNVGRSVGPILTLGQWHLTTFRSGLSLWNIRSQRSNRNRLAVKIRQSTVAQRRPESTGSGHASGHSSRSACDGGGQIRFSSVCANATARSSGMRPITRRLRPPRDHQASDRLSRRSERIVASGASLAMMQSKTGAPEGST